MTTKEVTEKLNEVDPGFRRVLQMKIAAMKLFNTSKTKIKQTFKEALHETKKDMIEAQQTDRKPRKTCNSS